MRELVPHLGAFWLMRTPADGDDQLISLADVADLRGLPTYHHQCGRN